MRGAATISAVRTAFITGCGRSGTTILGQLLGRRGDVSYLNDRFDLWADFPEADIWGKLHAEMAAGARVSLGREDATRDADARERFVRGLERHRAGRAVLVEKLAINNFRHGFLLGLVPDAAIVNIVRHGVEVAFSIQERARAGRWYGVGDRKWLLLERHAREVGLGGLLELCRTPFERGLLEWRLSVDAADAWHAGASGARFLRVRYEAMLADPLATCDALDEFLGLPSSAEMREFAASALARRSPPAGERDVPETTEAIAGDALRRLGYWPTGGVR